ncbi:MAG TPA: histidine phosphatase family protein [Candidatus Dormibacteraeota bacterium]|nr:histidine phosphatase family protein [Candidatus Dormibacteraeota bacterium]
MSTVYLVRHGQAGTRDAYDSLSELGQRQARLLGEHFISQGIRFASAYAGALTRQQQTAEQIRAVYAGAGVAFPTVRVDSGWDEFDLGRVYREIAPLLAAEDPEFLREYDEMREQVRVSQGAHGARIHRKWMPCDTKVVEAWLSARYPYGGETWGQFRERVAACRLKMLDARQENILVVTSATPLAIWTGLSLEISDQRIMRLAAAVYNASYTILRLRKEQLRLFTFNTVPHLAAPGLCTHR